ncbi:hypothetical protein B0I35DRAFT_479596 [Stachybotrys elegans]|uniref:Oxidase ustYa n=1 Tax=Stachybotrys elegans TaxID=80388 RepID=A0A8K0SNI0_9HYPO|nr:hypothetical protein B0I35DRAFT_479596 [Stachybotrys elegans]
MNPSAWFMPQRHDYNTLPGNEDKKPSTARARYHVLLKSALVGLLAVLSFFAGRLSSTNVASSDRDVIELGTNSHLFQYNRTFGEAPSPDTNAAWESLFPHHGGFFVHAELAPKRSAFSVFHQLHCLDELRHGFYVLHDQVIEYSDMLNAAPPPDGRRRLHEEERRALHEHSLGHIRHCIDLLRQSLMCNADLTVELKNEELGGVTGFGTEHRCVDWPGLLDWIRPYEETDAPPIPDHID